MATQPRTLSASAVKDRSVVLVSPDADLRRRLSERLLHMRWTVLEAGGGAEAMAYLGDTTPEALIVDHWLPDLHPEEFSERVLDLCPTIDLLQMDGSAGAGVRSARRNELLHALRDAQDAATSAAVSPTSFLAQQSDGAAWKAAPVVVPRVVVSHAVQAVAGRVTVELEQDASPSVEPQVLLPGIVGASQPMRQLASDVRLVAPRSTGVLILGETGTGKELVAHAVHRLSTRGTKPFVVLNCAAIPEHLLEAELFGHTRGAFTGAVTSRTGRIEAAHGGTLFLDEIGEMPLALQSKMLRFLENGELQRVGDNETLRVDVRIVAATHQPLQQDAAERRFREDLYHRLAVFPVTIAPLRERADDIPMLVEHKLALLGAQHPRKGITTKAMELLLTHAWPGNVRELGHVIERGTILCGDHPRIDVEHIRFC